MAGQAMEAALQKEGLKRLATELAGRLVAEGFIVHRYNAYSTNSIYLKLDYGVCNSIRISDHKGKAYLKYRYNLGTDIEKIELKQDKYPRWYFPAKDVGLMVEQILKDRKEKTERYGYAGYQRYMRSNKKEHAEDKGFWSKSYRVF